MPGAIVAVPFDPERLELTGPPVPVVQGVASNRGDTSVWGLSREGTLAYFPGGLQAAQDRLVWVDRQGKSEPLRLGPGNYQKPRISPDGSQVVVRSEGTQSGLLIYDLADDNLTRLSLEGNNGWPLWTPDGKRVVFASNRAEPWDLFWTPADGSGKEELLLAKQFPQAPYSFSPDGKVLLFSHTEPATAQDVWVLALDGQRRAEPLLQTSAVELDATLSPDGRFLAYASNESGENEIYVRPFPNVEGGKWQISAEGGREPLWAHSGRELFYRSGDRMMVVAVQMDPNFRTENPTSFRGSCVR